LDPRLEGRVFILETPRSPEEDAWNLRVLRGWLEEAPSQEKA
ncbi:MAG: endonuclease IV, partial [Thermus sp.]|nr:endonuclease IV [Thermus sp.]